MTLYKTKLKKTTFESYNTNCEDGINFISSNGSINYIKAKDSLYDGIDIDFSSLNIENIEIENSLNDCLDLSYGAYTMKKLDLNNIEIEISKMVNHNVLNYLFMLANSKRTHEEVNARVYNSLNILKVKLDEMSSDNYHFKYLSNKIEKFMSGEVDINYPDELVPPDGSPIGSFMKNDHICESEL